MPTITTTKTGIKNGSPVELIYHKLFRGNSVLIQINATKLISPWNTMSENLIIKHICDKINNIEKYQFNVMISYYDKITTYNDYIIGTGDFLFVVETIDSINEDMIITIQSALYDLNIMSSDTLPTYYVESYGTHHAYDGLTMENLPTLSVFLFHFYGDRTLLYKSRNLDVLNSMVLSKLKTESLANDIILPEGVKVFTANRNYDDDGNAVIGDEFAIELYDESYSRTADFDTLLNGLYSFLKTMNINYFVKIWVQTTSIQFLL